MTMDLSPRMLTLPYAVRDRTTVLILIDAGYPPWSRHNPTREQQHKWLLNKAALLRTIVAFLAVLKQRRQRECSRDVRTLIGKMMWEQRWGFQ